MSKFKARVIVELQFEATDILQALNLLQLKGEGIIQVLGILPAEEPWPNPAQEEQPFKRPPRNTPPSGSPGTPTPGKAPEFVRAVAA